MNDTVPSKIKSGQFTFINSSTYHLYLLTGTSVRQVKSKNRREMPPKRGVLYLVEPDRLAEREDFVWIDSLITAGQEDVVVGTRLSTTIHLRRP